jgi:hypothetical protein
MFCVFFLKSTLVLDEATLVLNRSNFLAPYVLMNLPSKYIVENVETMSDKFSPYIGNRASFVGNFGITLRQLSALNEATPIMKVHTTYIMHM